MSESNKIERIEKEISEIKSALGKLENLERVIEDLKRGLIDLRTTLNDVENPFNLLKLITSEEDLAKISETKPILEKVTVEKGIEGTSAKDVEERAKGEAVKEEHTEPVNHIKEPSTAHVKEPPPRLDFKKIIELIEWVYTMPDLGFDEDYIRNLCQYSEFFDLIPKGSAQHISSLSNVVRRARSNNIAEDTFILSLYSLANIIGSASDQTSITSLIKSFLRSRRFNGACNRAWGSQ